MSYLTVGFEQEVSVPEWKYCNEQESATKRGHNYCRFKKGERNEINCKLFEKNLFVSYDMVLKCDMCLEKSKIDVKENK